MAKYRLEYAKVGLARFLSHLELLRSVLRALRRARLPLAYTQGFSPRPKLTFGPPLPVGVAGMKEYLDFELQVSLPPQYVQEQLCASFPKGLEVRRVVVLPPFASGLGKLLDAAWYRLCVGGEEDAEVWRRIKDELVQGTEPWLYQRAKDGKVFDLREGVREARLLLQGGRVYLDLLVRLGAGEVPLRGFLEALPQRAGYPPLAPHQVVRLGVFRSSSGGLVTPVGEEKALWEE